MKILQINASYKPAFIYGGPTMSVARLSERLAQAGVDVDVFTTTANGDSELDVVQNSAVNIDGVRVFYFPRVTGDHSHFSPRLLFRLWRVVPDYDLVHIHAWWNLVSVFSALIAHMRKVPVIISPRGTLSGYSFVNKKAFIKKKMHNLLGRNLLDRSFIHVTSPAEAESLAFVTAPRGIFNVPNFVKLPNELPPRINDDDVFKIIFLSRIEEKKGLEILLKALSLVKYPFRLTIAGGGRENYVLALKGIVAGEGLTDKITWAGFQGGHKFELLRSHDLLVLPSYDENFGNVVIESLAMGTAVLLSKYVGLADYVRQNNLGWICDTAVDAVGQSIIDIIENGGHELMRIRRDAPAMILKDFNEDKLIQAYIGLYKQITAHE